MKSSLNSHNSKDKKELFKLIDNYNYKELSSYIQDKNNEIWNIFIEDNKNCLHYTCEKGDEKMIVFIIIQLKIRLGINDCFNNKSDNLIKNINIFKYFINSKAKSNGYTPLHYAILSYDSLFQLSTQQNINIIKFLLSNYADIKIKTKSNQNVLHLCAISNNTNALVLFKEKYLININEKDDQLKTPLHYCAEKNNYECLNILINYKDIDVDCIDIKGNTPLHYAIINSHSKTIKKLIQYCANINIKTRKNKSSPKELGLKSLDKEIRNIFEPKTIYQQLFFEQTIKKGETNIYKIIFFILIHIFALFLNYYILMPYYTERNSFLSILYIIITFITFLYYFVLFFSNPGYKDNSDSCYSNLLEVLDDKKDVIKYCPITFIILEDNSRYCLICQKYIKGFNHHCYWVGNCIGENNFNKFIFFLGLCIVNIGYNLLLIILYFMPAFLFKYLNFNKKEENDFDIYKSIPENEIKDEESILYRVFRGFLGLIGLYICIVFLVQLIELFKYHYKGMKEREKKKNKNKI